MIEDQVIDDEKDESDRIESDETDDLVQDDDRTDMLIFWNYTTAIPVCRVSLLVDDTIKRWHDLYICCRR